MAEMNLAIVIQAIDNATAAIRGITDVVEGMKRSVESVKDAATTASEGIKGISDTASNVAGAVKSASEGMKQSVEGVKNSANVTAEGIKGIGKAVTIAAGAAAYLRERFETAFRAINRAANWVIGTLIAGFYSTIRLGDEYSRFETLFGIPADVAYVWKNTFQELDINFDNFVAGARSVGRGFMQLEQMMPKPKEKKEKQIITPQGLANLKLMAEHYKNLSQYNYYYSQTAKQLAKEVEKELKKLERSLYKVKVQQQKMAEQPFFSPQTLAVLTQMEQKYRQLSAAGYDYISISIEIARMLNQIANETERVAVAQMLFRQGAYEALGIARLPRKKIEQTREAWRQIAPSRETILQADALGDELKRVFA
jgi:methyl-accepting chemotaxis protein